MPELALDSGIITRMAGIQPNSLDGSWARDRRE